MPVSLSVYSGINGVVGSAVDGSTLSPTPVTAVNAINKWDMNHKAEASELASSATSQAMDRVAGNDDWDGNYGAYGDQPSFLPGDFFMMYGILTELSASVGGPTTKFMSGRAIADEFSMKLDIEGAKEIEHSVKMSCAYNGILNGQLTPGATEGALFPDSNLMNVLSASGCCVAVCYPGASTWYVLKDVRSVDLSLKASNKNYHSSATAYLDTSITPNVWRNWCGRVRGNIDASISLSQYALPEELIPSKAVLGVRIYTQPPTITPAANPTYLYLDGSTGTSAPGIAVTGTVAAGRFWEIDWVMFQAHSGIEVDRKNANIIGASTNGGLKAVANVGNLYLTGSGGTPTIGKIVKPDGTTWWPWTLPKL